MKTKPIQEGALIVKGVGIGTVTRGMIRLRAAELAVINGHPANEPSKSDWDEAERELTGGSELDPKHVLLESVPQSEHWDPVPGSTGHEAPVSFNDGEDEDGRSDSERVFEEGVEEAGHDQMLQAAVTPPVDDSETVID
ncbi:MAG: DUF2934 domain-containing protein [Burkholderiaceae bacterium]|nr:DUF2934 domain-containing protein [Burkholderiaceae bacterium]